MDPCKLLIALNASGRITRAALCRLAGLHDEWQHLRRDTDAARYRLAASLGVPSEQLRRALELRPRAAALADREIRRAERIGCRLITRLDEDYPPPLLDHALPPPVLYCRGTVPDGPAVAIVGSRRMSDYGGKAAKLFGAQLAAAGVTIVSGFARGIDTAAHRSALAAERGKTVAVLGCGIDIDYPRGNADLAVEICRRGAVLSEFPLGAEPRAWHFPIRNRVIAALAVGTLVVQATFKSGSLITAHLALDLGREVYAVPGSIFADDAAGTNALIADGALLVRSPRDILESLTLGQQQELFPPPAPPRPAGPPAAAAAAADAFPAERKPPAGVAGKVLESLEPGNALTAEEVSARAGVPIDRTLGALLELELTGWVRRQPGPVYLR